MGIGVGAFSDSAAEIVGVVGDVKYGSLEDDPRPEAYVPLLQVPDLRGLMVMVRTVGDPRALIPSVRRAVVAEHPDLPIYDVKTMEDRSAEANARTRASTMLLGFFAAVALGLAAVGIYGVIAYSVGQSTREVGLRIALGATRADMFSLVLGRGMMMVAAGAFVGLIAALVLSRFLASLLYGVTATDPATFGLITALLAAVALAAAFLPARRATRVDPMVALRSE
jgi:ABC-type antimicrobial peptide transport system permease subunit